MRQKIIQIGFLCFVVNTELLKYLASIMLLQLLGLSLESIFVKMR